MAEGFPRFFGDYVLLKPLGAGAMGGVYLARPRDPLSPLPQALVIKQLHGQLSDQVGFVDRFRHEAELAVCIDSPHIARVFDVGAVGDTYYMAMEWVSGWPLSEVMQRLVRMQRHAASGAAVDFLHGALKGLKDIHRAQHPITKQSLEIVHRDLSPKNIMIDLQGQVRLIDLGLGRSTAQNWRTQTGLVMGSLGYMAPEQALGERVDGRADIYAVGVIAYEILTLRNYLEKGSKQEMIQSALQGKHRLPSHYRPDIDPRLDQVIAKAVEPQKAQRFASASEFQAALQAVVPAEACKGGLPALLKTIYGDSFEQPDRELAQLLAAQVSETEAEPQPEVTVFGSRDGLLSPHTQVDVALGVDDFAQEVAQRAAVVKSARQPQKNRWGLAALVTILLALGGVTAFLGLTLEQGRPSQPVPLVKTEPAPSKAPVLSVTQRQKVAVVPQVVAQKAPIKRRASLKAKPAVVPQPAVASKQKKSPALVRSKTIAVRKTDSSQNQLLKLRKNILGRRAKLSASSREEANRIVVEIGLWLRSNDETAKKEALSKLLKRSAKL